MQIALNRISLQGSFELARSLVETTIGAQRFIEGICGVGGPVHLATLTRDGLTWVQSGPLGVSPTLHDIVEEAPAVMCVPAAGIGAASFTIMA